MSVKMKHIKVEDKNHVRTIELNRPERRNAFHPGMIDELTSVFRDSEGLRAVVLRGAGDSFCSGGDLEWMKSMAGYTYEENKKDSLALFDMFQAASSISCPLLGRVHGHAFGGALGLIAVCDIVVAEAGTQFCFSEVRWGLAPAVISPFVVAKMAPHKAREWMLTAKVFSAAEAADAGLVHFVGSTEQIDESLSKTLHKISQAGPEAVRATKQLLHFLSENAESAYRTEAARVIAERRVSAEGQKGLQAFFAKTKPDWNS